MDATTLGLVPMHYTHETTGYPTLASILHWQKCAAKSSRPDYPATRTPT
ncbi:uncharacterized protein FRV6_16935 [Fusarium oxysporum]|uniref:Uncharacterized protein n=1 Tax=Fusarium oxysporum TaxID=5507 RepID=A0A2H3TW36_FUSOX|nr:uncharacterized protein FRV6_16935 [Fusarium oxysporum]